MDIELIRSYWAFPFYFSDQSALSIFHQNHSKKCARHLHRDRWVLTSTDATPGAYWSPTHVSRTIPRPSTNSVKSTIFQCESCATHEKSQVFKVRATARFITTEKPHSKTVTRQVFRIFFRYRAHPRRIAREDNLFWNYWSHLVRSRRLPLFMMLKHNDKLRSRFLWRS